MPERIEIEIVTSMRDEITDVVREISDAIGLEDVDKIKKALEEVNTLAIETRNYLMTLPSVLSSDFVRTLDKYLRDIIVEYMASLPEKIREFEGAVREFLGSIRDIRVQFIKWIEETLTPTVIADAIKEEINALIRSINESKEITEKIANDISNISEFQMGLIDAVNKVIESRFQELRVMLSGLRDPLEKLIPKTEEGEEGNWLQILKDNIDDIKRSIEDEIEIFRDRMYAIEEILERGTFSEEAKKFFDSIKTLVDSTNSEVKQIVTKLQELTAEIQGVVREKIITIQRLERAPIIENIKEIVTNIQEVNIPSLRRGRNEKLEQVRERLQGSVQEFRTVEQIINNNLIEGNEDLQKEMERIGNKLTELGEKIDIFTLKREAVEVKESMDEFKTKLFKILK